MWQGKIIYVNLAYEKEITYQLTLSQSFTKDVFSVLPYKIIDSFLKLE